MAFGSPKKKPERSGRGARANGGPGWLARARAGIGRLTGEAAAAAIGGAALGGRIGTAALITHARRALLGLLAVGAGIGWIMGYAPLREAVARLRTESPRVVFHWPLSTTGERRGETWMPAALQHELVRTAAEGLTGDPFDQDALRKVQDRVRATGWFDRIDGVRRGPGGEVEVVGKWRVPAAVVRRHGRELLVASGSEVLRLPEGLPVSPGSMPIIFEPYAPAPSGEEGSIRYGEPWPGGDVPDAIRLIGLLKSRPGYERIIGIELTGYMRTGRLTLVSDTGARFVWGSTLGRPTPGEAPIERRLANLKSILDERRDAPGYRFEIYTPFVLVDTTMARD